MVVSAKAKGASASSSASHSHCRRREHQISSHLTHTQHRSTLARSGTGWLWCLPRSQNGGSFETTGVESAAPRCSRGSTCTLAPPVAPCRLGVGASCESAAGDWLGACLWVSIPPKAISAQPAGAVIHSHSFAQPNHEGSNLRGPQQPSSCARRLSHQPLPGTQLSCLSSRDANVTRIGWCLGDCPRPPSMHHRHHPEDRYMPAGHTCSQSGDIGPLRNGS